MSHVLLDARPPRNAGRRDPADLPTVLEIIAVMRRAGMGAWAGGNCRTPVPKAVVKV